MRIKNVMWLFLGLLLSTTAFCQQNKVVRLDGEDNYLPIGMGTIEDNWTVEAWIKGDGNAWNELEAIIGAGYYATFNNSDHMALVIKDGMLHNNGAKISSSEPLPTDKWLHVAATSNGKATTIYLNGDLVASRDTSTTIIPGAIGAVDSKESLFGGMIDEVRIWKSALSQDEIKNWMSQPINPTHPKFDALCGYYTFDSFATDVSINRVSKGPLSYHVRNDRIDYYGDTPLAKVVECDIDNFNDYSDDQRLFNATVISSEWDSDLGECDQQIVKLRVIVDGDSQPLTLDKITLDLSQCSDIDDLSKLNIYYTGSTPRSDIKEPICESITRIKDKIVVKIDKGVEMKDGVNYFLVSGDISNSATVGNMIKVTIPTFTLSGDKITPITDDLTQNKYVSVNSKSGDNILKVIQWNIWHGGIHVGGKPGRQRVIDLIDDSNSDIVLMQEAYGSQEQIADSLGFEMLTSSADANLALFSRYPLEQIDTDNPFYSNPAYVTLPSGKKMYVNDIWIKYAYRPEYTIAYCSDGLDSKVWEKEDATLGLLNLKRTMATDVEPYVKPGMDIIFGGDFNSGSHLDWTQRAAHLHNGYVAEGLPNSRYMYEQGYVDTFRSVHPDEVAHPDGTYAPIFGHTQTSRIDFIYYKGSGIKPIFSRVIRTAYEIDDVWAGDHAAVLTTFKIIE